MSASPESSVLQSLLNDAIDEYKTQVGTSLIENQLATQLGTCDDVQSVAALLEERVQAFRDFLGRDRHPKMKQSIGRTVHLLHTILASLGGAIDSIVRLNSLMVTEFVIPHRYSIAVPTCEINIFCHRYPPRSTCPPLSPSVHFCDVLYPRL
jgi:hypothetical protein